MLKEHHWLADVGVDVIGSPLARRRASGAIRYESLHSQDSERGTVRLDTGQGQSRHG